MADDDTREYTAEEMAELRALLDGDEPARP